MSNVSQTFENALWASKNTAIRFFGDHILNEPCATVAPEEIKLGEAQRIANEMINTLKRYRNQFEVGRGLAANQIGFAKQIVLVWLNDGPKIFINPKLVSHEGKGSYWESCLSSGFTVIGEVIRPWMGVFTYLSLDGSEQTISADEQLTRILLHEMDHLCGENCIEKYTPGTLRIVHEGKAEILSYKLKRLE